MDFIQACERLAQWVDMDNDAPRTMPSGSSLSFRLTRRYSLEEVQAFQSRWHVQLPEAYQHFLVVVGACRCFVGSYGSGLTFYELEELPEIYARVFEVPDLQNLDDWVFVLAHTGLGDLGGFYLKRIDSSNFTVPSHEYPPEEWVEDTDEVDAWEVFEQWLVRVVSTEGKGILR